MRSGIFAPSVRQNRVPGSRLFLGLVARHVVEVIRFDDPEYESGKAEKHGRVRTLGCLFRMEAPQFDSRHNPLRRQRGRIGADARSDILRRRDRK